jgi:tRNA (cytidine/uridine-2'-O-)-methyltransferase
MHVALVEPEIAPNTGTIARLCAATGAQLHLVGRLGFHLDDRRLRRAGVDSWDRVTVLRHADWSAFAEALAGVRFWLFSTRAARFYTTADYRAGDCLVFGSESRGLPASLLERHADRALLIPMPAGGVRSLNLATAAGIALYEALRQINGW